jgi:multiple sugar transport system ATP-binding protein
VTLTVELAEQMGAESIIYLKTGGRSLTARIFGEHHYQSGEKFTAHINLEKAHLFDAETE